MVSATNMSEVRLLQSQGFQFTPGSGFSGWTQPFSYGSSPPAIAPAPTFTTPTPPVAMGIEPAAYDVILYGKEIPKFVGGRALMGGRIVEGVFFGGTQADPTVSFVAFHAIAANPSGTRTITSARLRGSEVWNSTSGYLDTTKVPSGSFDYRTGSPTQTAFTQSVGRYGSGAIAYRNGILSSWTDIPLKPFGGIVPMPSIEISDSSFGDPSDGITRQDAIEVILRDARFDEDQFDVDVPGSDPAWIIPAQMTMLEFLQNLRSLFVHWNINYDDRLRVVDPNNFGIAADITTANFTQGSMVFSKTDPLTIPREQRYSYIDIDRDYEPHTVMASEDIYPAPSTSSVETRSVELPIVTTAAQATADANVSLYEQLASRSQMEAILEPSLFQIVAGDVVRFADSDYINFIGRVVETEHDFNTYQVSMKAIEVLNCGVSDCSYDMTDDLVTVDLYDDEDFNDQMFGGLHFNGHIYVAGAGTSPIYSIARVSTSTFSSPEYLDVGAEVENGDTSNPFTDGTYVYVIYESSTAASGYAILRVDADFMGYTTVDIDGSIGWSNDEVRTVVLGGYVYVVAHQSLQIDRVNFATGATSTILTSAIDASVGFIDGIASDGERYLYISATKNDEAYLWRLDTQEFAPSGVTSVVVASERFCGPVGVADGYAYVADWHPGFDKTYAVRVTIPDMTGATQIELGVGASVSWQDCRFDGCGYVYLNGAEQSGFRNFVARINTANNSVETMEIDPSLGYVSQEIAFDGDVGDGYVYFIGSGYFEEVAPKFLIGRMPMF